MLKVLHAGERFIFNNYYTFAVNKRGALEIYAVGGARKYF